MASKKTAKKAAGNSGEFAVILTGGKQYKVSVGDKVKIEKLAGKNEIGGKVIFDKVILTDDGSKTVIGAPFIDGAKVEAILKEEGKGKKIEVMKYKAKSRYMKIRGHRQPYMEVEIVSIK